VVKQSSDLWACGKGWRRGHLLGSNSSTLTGEQSVSSIRVAGHFVAWALHLQDHENTSDYVFVADAVRGRGHGYANGGPPRNVLSAGIGPTRSLVLEPQGGVAWIAEDSSNAQTFEVHAVSRPGRRLLASGGGIDPRSLAGSATTIYWTQDGTARSAPF
jgi:hypothetical protein